MTDNLDRALRSIQEKLELLTGERAKGERRAVLISEFNGAVEDFSDATQSMKKVVSKLEAEFNSNIASITEELLVQADADSAVAQKIETLKAQVNDNIAQIQQTKRAVANKTMALTEVITALTSTVGTNNASIYEIQRTYADDQIALAEDLTRIEATAGKKRSFRQTAAPENTTGTGGNNLIVGDMWFDTDDSNKPYYWDGSAWVDTSSQSGVKVYRQTSAPTTGLNVGDLWYDTDDNNKVWYWDGAAWDDVSDGRAGKLRTFNQATAPANDATNNLAVGDLWFDTDDSNKVYRWNGSSWADISDGRFANYATTAALDDVQIAYVSADGALAQRVIAASVGGARVYWQPSPPGNTSGQPGYPRQTGDVWFDTDDNYKVYSWQGSWVDNTSGTYKTGSYASIAQTVSTHLDAGGTLSAQWALIGTLGGGASPVMTVSGSRKSDGSTSSYGILFDANVEMRGTTKIADSSGNWIILANRNGSTGASLWKPTLYVGQSINGVSDPTKPAFYAECGNSQPALHAKNTSSTDQGAHGIRATSADTLWSVGVVSTGKRFDFYAESHGYGPFTGGHDALTLPSEIFECGDILVDVECLARNGISNTLCRVQKSTASNQKGVVGVFVSSMGLLSDGPPMAVFDQIPDYPSAQEGPQNSVDAPEPPPPVNNEMTPVWNALKDNYHGIIMNAVGEGQVNVCGENGDIEIGDLIVTSSIPGKGMKQDDDIIRNTTVAKARENVTFASPTEVKMVACIYLCG